MNLWPKRFSASVSTRHRAGVSREEGARLPPGAQRDAEEVAAASDTLPVLLASYTNISGRTSPTSIMTSAGMFSRSAASRMASAFGASYRQYVFFLSALRNENSHWIPTSALTWLICRASSRFISTCSAKLRSIRNRGIHISFYHSVCPPPVEDDIGSGPVERGAHYIVVHGSCLPLLPSCVCLRRCSGL